jgi:isochorismate synthase
MKTFLDKTKHHFEQNLPFVVYKKPNETIVSGIFQENDVLYSVNDFTEKGFVFASFDGSQTYIIPDDKSQLYNVAYDFQSFQNNIQVCNELQNELEKINFKKLVSKSMAAIKQGEIKKVVVSRKETVDLQSFDVIGTFEKLVQLYPSTFVYCFYHSKVGLWFGATPEQLLKSNEGLFETIALAGTQKDKDNNTVVWAKKEQEEQQYVTDYIIEKLINIASNLLVSEPYSIKAGSIWHIKTDISGLLNSDSDLKKVIQLLHPTPAVCGLPKAESKSFILDNEQYDRTFYTGFLGELNRANKTDLFVNLRCMEIVSELTITKAHLFMGCGITKDSVPEKEWEENINKSATMKKVLDY